MKAARSLLPTSLRHFARAVVSLLYPPLCLACEARLPEAPPLPLCAACLRRLPRADADALDARLARLPEGLSAFITRRALWYFDPAGPLQQIQHALKYGNRPGLGVRLGRAVGEAWAAEGLPRPDAVVPVPLNRVRRLERGYNQSEQLAQGLAEVLGSPVRPDLLVRHRPTPSQTNLSQQARWENVAGAFACPASLDDQTVLLVDDVFTTGATTVAAAAPLRAAGATVALALLACTRE